MTSTRIKSLKWARSTVEEFLRLEAFGGFVLVFAAAIAMIWANSPAGPFYDTLLALPVSIQAGAFAVAKPLLMWINDGLMAIFFLLVGLEIKREALEGELSSLDRAACRGSPQSAASFSRHSSTRLSTRRILRHCAAGRFPQLPTSRSP